ncbi:membrane protein [Bacteroidia bacterium]|nr:membrane protein [Bacteroidia bacterium]
MSNYWAIPSYSNPGHTGLSGKPELTGLYRLQWLGVENAPKTGIVIAEMPLSLFGVDFGAGLSMYSDQIGLFATTTMSGQIAASFAMKQGRLSIGVRGGKIDESFDGTKVEIPSDDDGTLDPDDAAIPRTKISGSAIDVGAGIFYVHEKGYAGLSVNHLLAPELNLGDKIQKIPRAYYLTAGYNIPLDNRFELKPSALLKYFDESSLVMENAQLDVSMRLVYNKAVWGGLSWRQDDAVVVMLGCKIGMFEVGYAYDYPISDIATVSSGSHELFIRCALELSQKKKSDKHKSVRLL